MIFYLVKVYIHLKILISVPSEPNITSLAVQFTIVSLTEVIVTFNYNLFKDDQGQIQYYALLLAVNHFPQLPQNGWLGYNRSWPKENTWAEVRQNNGAVTYQTTPLFWDPFKGKYHIIISR